MKSIPINSPEWLTHRVSLVQSAFTPGYQRAMDSAIAKSVAAFEIGGTLYLCGNGGSAADAQHITAEFVGRFQSERPGIRAHALSTDTSILTAWANDYSYETVFARQVETFCDSKDVVWGISTSGTSVNVVRAMEAARTCGVATIGLAGNNGGQMAAVTDFPLFIELQETARIQEVHRLTYNRICELVEGAMMKNS